MAIFSSSSRSSSSKSYSASYSTSRKVAPKTKEDKTQESPLVKYYLILYNACSTIGWAYLLILTIVHLFNLDGKTKDVASLAPQTASSSLFRFLSTSATFIKSAAYSVTRDPPNRYIHTLVVNASSVYNRVGVQTAWIQSFALLEVIHVLLGLVRSSLLTTAMQVSSRLYIVWGIVEQVESTRSNPIYASMVFAWSLTEVIRYMYYVCSLLGVESAPLVYMRYSGFYVLYPLGAGSEAALIFSTLPRSLPFVRTWFGAWTSVDYFRAALFCIWWPSLYVMYTHMMRQRRKVLGQGKSRLVLEDNSNKSR